MNTTRLLLVSLTALALAAPLSAQEKIRTKTYEGEKYTATQTTTVNPETGTATRDRAATNRATGETATSTAVRQRTDTGATIDVTQTGTRGRTRSLEGERTRTENGSTFTGTATGRGGETYGLEGSRSRDGQGNSQASQRVTDSDGRTLAARDRVTTRADGQVSRTVTTTRAEGVSRPPRARRPRG
ncbi:hypothetical protein [Erythrobacter sp. BLCC-B19]|uniref:hypothetical protein n=1 Tax=Erythrobacter sp. BLCC-B19 TaxID=3025315 RepID=UPI002361F1DB|nr:hypothetical protein [Erythrobacter sp. BLCC-B19]WDA40236.1 hypothetical protein PS060_11775 [Erythrobacter sp. BLCC-B19]